MRDDSKATFLASWIWKSDILPRIQTFTWMCAHNSIGVRECFERKGVLEEMNCPLCNRETESVLHAFHDCEKIKPVWIQLGIKMDGSLFLDREPPRLVGI